MRSGLKNMAAAVLPRTVVAALIRSKPTKELQLDLLENIRNASEEELRNRQWVEEELLPKLGLNDEYTWELPASLLPYTGKGLRSWQYPNQFSKYLDLIRTRPIKTYLEIGVRHGGTFAITTEFLKRFTSPVRCIAVDFAASTGTRSYCRTEGLAEFHQVDTWKDGFKELVADASPIDLVLIDGGHDHKTCRNDLDICVPRSNIIAIHDIVSYACPGVRKAWAEMKQLCTTDFDFVEITDQYDEVLKREKKEFYGIGLMIRKDWITS